ncbi:MAG: hypothetical protein WC340_15125 [Kiritimatiellia bacterium]
MSLTSIASIISISVIGVLVLYDMASGNKPITHSEADKWFSSLPVWARLLVAAAGIVFILSLLAASGPPSAMWPE